MSNPLAPRSDQQAVGVGTDVDHSTQGAPSPSWLTKWSFRHLLRAILGADDTPHRIALGAAIGVFVGLTPTFLIQTPLVLLVALVCRPFFKFNIIAAVIAGQVTNPLTNIPIYYFQYLVGTVLVGDGGATFERFTELFGNQSWGEWWGGVKLLAVDIGKPLLVGSAIVSPLCGLATYPMVRKLAENVQKRHIGKQPSK